MKKRVAVFIDGLNTRCRLEQCGWEEDFDVLHLSQRLGGNRELVGVHYYVPNPNKDHLGEDRYSRERRYLAKVERQGVKVSRGYMKQHDGRWEEKMVDVLIASDMVYFAALGAYDDAILVTADGDLVPAINRVKDLSRKVELLEFRGANVNYGNLHKESSLTRRARRSYFKPIFQ
ncbi:hypothetical protein ES703_04554 [subsurface metagenome]